VPAKEATSSIRQPAKRGAIQQNRAIRHARTCPKVRFRKPWRAEETDACFIIRGHNDQALVYVYYEEEPGQRSAANLLSRDEARRIAVNKAKLPELQLTYGT
jgi:hypothetical protein